LDKLSDHTAGSLNCICSAADIDFAWVTLGEVLIDNDVSLAGLLQSSDSLTTSPDDASYDAWWTFYRPLHFTLRRVVTDDLLNKVLGCL